MKFIIGNLTGRRVWLTVRHDFYRDIVHVRLHARQPPRKTDVELYDDLSNGQGVVLNRLALSETTVFDFDDSEFEPKLKVHQEDQADDDGLVRVFTLKISNGAH